jgi:hypothetical protein
MLPTNLQRRRVSWTDTRNSAMSTLQESGKFLIGKESVMNIHQRSVKCVCLLKLPESLSSHL